MENLPSVDEIRRELRSRGWTITGWARATGFSRAEVYALLNGRTRGHWGRAHEVAVALGLKASPEKSGRFQCLDAISLEHALDGPEEEGGKKTKEL